MKLGIDLDENEIKELVTAKIVNQMYLDTVSRESRMIKSEIKQAVRDVIYKQKEEIIDRVVKQASAEMVRKGITKLLEASHDTA